MTQAIFTVNWMGWPTLNNNNRNRCWKVAQMSMSYVWHDWLHPIIVEQHNDVRWGAHLFRQTRIWRRYLGTDSWALYWTNNVRWPLYGVWLYRWLDLQRAPWRPVVSIGGPNKYIRPSVATPLHSRLGRVVDPFDCPWIVSNCLLSKDTPSKPLVVASQRDIQVLVSHPWVIYWRMACSSRFYRRSHRRSMMFCAVY